MTKAKSLFCGLVAVLLASYSAAKEDPAVESVSIGVILPFKTSVALEQLNRSLDAPEAIIASRMKLNEEARLAMDFMLGMHLAVSDSAPLLLNLHVYDNYDNDSVTRVLLRENESKLKTHNIIIGPNSTSSARIVADFCRKHKIWNIQPFTPSRSVGDSNLYLIRLNPSIESIMRNVYESLKDSFTGANIIIHSVKRGVEYDAARLLDSLIRSDANFSHATLTLCVTGDTTIKTSRCNMTDLLRKDKRNVVVSTALNMNVVQSFIRTLDANNTVLYGMPNWLYSDFVRLDYLNQLNTRLPENFLPDTANPQWLDFRQRFLETYETEPSRYACQGYDVLTFLKQQIGKWGMYFMTQPDPITFDGAGYSFRISRNLKNASISSWENNYCHILMLQNYQLNKVR